MPATTSSNMLAVSLGNLELDGGNLGNEISTATRGGLPPGPELAPGAASRPAASGVPTHSRPHSPYTEDHPDVLGNAQKVVERRMTIELKRQLQSIMEGDTLQRYIRRLTMHTMNDRYRLDQAPASRLTERQQHVRRPETVAAACRGPGTSTRVMFAGGRTQTRKTLLIAVAAVVGRAMHVPTVVLTSSCTNRDNLTDKIRQVRSRVPPRAVAGQVSWHVGNHATLGTQKHHMPSPHAVYLPSPHPATRLALRPCTLLHRILLQA